MAKIIIKKKESTQINGRKCLNCGKPLNGRRTKFCCDVCKQSYYDDVNGHSYSPYSKDMRKFYV